MSEWRQQIARKFVPGVARVTAVSDLDGLLRDPILFQAIESKGFSIVQFEDSVAFRFDYESRFRSNWDSGGSTEVVIAFKPGEHQFETLPIDVLANAQRLAFTLKDIFPKLSYAVVSQLETVYFDALYHPSHRLVTQELGDTMTHDFVLQHVFGIVPNIIKTEKDLLLMLCQRHYRKESIPKVLDDYLIVSLRENPNFHGWPLEQLVSNRTAFWEFLDERWHIYVDQNDGETGQIEERAQALKYPGPTVLPFGHDNIRVYIDNLFDDGLLTPLNRDWNPTENRQWIRVGLAGNKTENFELRFQELGKALLEGCPITGATPQAWLTYAFRYAQSGHLWAQVSSSARAEYATQFPEMRGYVNQRFLEWLKATYGGLYNYPATSPLMVHHIPKYLAHQLASNQSQRVAFILIDGLAIDQWMIIRDKLKTGGLPAAIEENALFAWMPTITPISRQATFSGKIPRYFADTIDQTNRDEAGWRQFWMDHGLSASETEFLSLHGDAIDRSTIEDLDLSDIRTLGITIYKVDKIMHGNQLGLVGMANQVQTWAEEGFLCELLKLLFAKGFDVFISSDHGNTEAVGMGRPQEGVLGDKQGERCRIYSDRALQKTCLDKFPDCIQWEPTGLPNGLSTVLAPYGKAFTQTNSTIVCHGGAALEEVCVPFIHIPSHD